MFNKRVKFFQFCLGALCAVYCSFSFAENCEGYLLPQNLPDYDEKTVIVDVAKDLGITDKLVASDDPALSLQPSDDSKLRWFAEENLLSSTQILLDSTPKALAESLAEEAFRLTAESFKHYKLILNTQLIQPQGRPRIRIGFISNKPEEEEAQPTLAVFAVAAEEDEISKSSLDLLRINLQFYKHYRDLLAAAAQTQE